MGVFVALQVRMSLSIDENEDVLQYWINDEERRRLDVSRSVRSFEVCHEGVVTSRPNGPRCVSTEALLPGRASVEPRGLETWGPLATFHGSRKLVN